MRADQTEPQEHSRRNNGVPPRFYTSVEPLVWVEHWPSLHWRLLSDKNGSQMSLISISLAVYTLESLSRDCRNSILCSVRHYRKQTRENARYKVNIHAHISRAYVAKIQPVWKQLPEWEIGWNQTRPVPAISCVPTKRSTKEIRFPHKIICTWQGGDEKGNMYMRRGKMRAFQLLFYRLEVLISIYK